MFVFPICPCTQGVLVTFAATDTVCFSFFPTETVIKKGMEELIEFLQIDLEKDFGYHDDEAINALLNSINELRRHKMELPIDPPLESEKPTKPFGFLLHADNVSISTAVDGHSVAGSINLNQEVITHSSSDESLTHIADEVKQLQQECK